jgi:hypothetical protein
MEACIDFAYQNYAKRRSQGYQKTRELTTKRGFNVEVTEIAHDDRDKSPCSTIFKVKTLKP